MQAHETWIRFRRRSSALSCVGGRGEEELQTGHTSSAGAYSRAEDPHPLLPSLGEQGQDDMVLIEMEGRRKKKGQC